MSQIPLMIDFIRMIYEYNIYITAYKLIVGSS